MYCGAGESKSSNVCVTSAADYYGMTSGAYAYVADVFVKWLIGTSDSESAEGES